MSKDINTGGSAFPAHWNGMQPPQTGMTLRDYFAASMVQSGHIFKCLNEGNTPERVAAQAYALADAMLKERSK
jgi:hypothetical protein